MKVTINKSGELVADVVSQDDITLLKQLMINPFITNPAEPVLSKTIVPESIIYGEPEQKKPVYRKRFMEKTDLAPFLQKVDLSRLPLQFTPKQLYHQVLGYESRNLEKQEHDKYVIMKEVVKILESDNKIKRLGRYRRMFQNLTLDIKPVTSSVKTEDRPVMETSMHKIVRDYVKSGLSMKNFVETYLPKFPNSFTIKDVFPIVFGAEYVTYDKVSLSQYNVLYQYMDRCVKMNLLTRGFKFLNISRRKIRTIIFTKVVEGAIPAVAVYQIEKHPEQQKPYTPSDAVRESGEDITYQDIPVIDTPTVRKILTTYDMIDAVALSGYKSKNGSAIGASGATYVFKWMEEHLPQLNRLVGRNFIIRGVGGYRYLESKA